MVRNLSNISYSRALLESSLEKNILDSVYNDISNIYNVLKSNDVILKTFRLPLLSIEKKISIFNTLFKKEVSNNGIIGDFFKILFKKYKEKEILDILFLFEEFFFLEKKIERVHIKSVKELTELQKRELVSKIGLTFDKVIFEEKINKSLIGGFILIHREKMYDASIKRKLLDIKNKVSV